MSDAGLREALEAEMERCREVSSFDNDEAVYRVEDHFKLMGETIEAILADHPPEPEDDLGERVRELSPRVLRAGVDRLVELADEDYSDQGYDEAARETGESPPSDDPAVAAVTLAWLLKDHAELLDPKGADDA